MVSPFPSLIRGLSKRLILRHALSSLSFAWVLFGAGELPAADVEFLGTELRDSFPVQGEQGTPPELQGGWEYFTEQAGTRLDGQAFVWEYHNPELWPNGRLRSGSAVIMHDPQYDDALSVVPGNNETDVALQWTAPVDGTFQVDGWFQKIQKTPDLAQETEGVELIIRGPASDELEKVAAGIEDTEVKAFSINLPDLKTGDTVQFVVRGITVNWGNETRLSARVAKE